MARVLRKLRDTRPDEAGSCVQSKPWARSLYTLNLDPHTYQLSTQGAQYGLIKQYTFNHIMDPHLISAKFFN